MAALVWSAKPSMSVDLLYAILKDPRGMIDCTSAAGQPDGDCGWGFLQADAKVNMALDASPPAVAAVTAPGRARRRQRLVPQHRRAELERGRS